MRSLGCAKKIGFKTSAILSRLDSVRQNSEHTQSPSCCDSKNKHERKSNCVIRIRPFAPALEHANRSNRKQQYRADGERFNEHERPPNF